MSGDSNLDQNDIDLRLKTIEERNLRVELDKDWETSSTRKIAIGLMTYLIVVLAMTALEIDRPFVGAVIPTVGFVLSTVTLPFIKARWIGRVASKRA
ncbi:MAG: hypothetical protein COW24_01795 [Candidatus Kerfeldbacteria bacterium CG15_BIG_FIL_POST_REV_8_21_14_020_45_12]|uniref:Uncharacterized protein n=1 Tax=Candidatus Kerfeldbacteria bacterium CG15_BIG_FIL_POST_REV_8_21_14_020_45_12 TaxID=2014247 RepID=A0A2M7H4L7_9BACT|nr:MAG: hypothetical protein COW24_01795 [Candidatus Kerfeldbacteria bacterium CG15_BIG_FIL_POST_REV_8_21_14_020_45_12]PJA93654.1 MAG: hypothetical protein CO132_02075 [Candidatus Kerfeldbacteria bacterium CG_4_9_14_3_um_filter_45_8]